jgi:hypothetical protein
MRKLLGRWMARSLCLLKDTAFLKVSANLRTQASCEMDGEKSAAFLRVSAYLRTRETHLQHFSESLPISDICSVLQLNASAYLRSRH